MRGMTAVEIIVVVAITVVLVSAAFPIYGNLQISSQLNKTTSQIIQTLRIARENSLNRFGSSSHGVKFESDRYILYQGESYSSRDTTYDREIILDDVLSINTDLVGNEINFSKSFGMPNVTGTITVVHNVDGVKYITINDFGISQEQ